MLFSHSPKWWALTWSLFLLVTSHRNWMFVKILPDMYLWTEKRTDQFCKLSACGYRFRNFFKDSSTFQDRTCVHTLTSITGQTDQVFVKMLPHIRLQIRQLQLNFWSNSDLDFGCPDSGQPWWRSLSALVRIVFQCRAANNICYVLLINFAGEQTAKPMWRRRTVPQRKMRRCR